MRKLPRVELDSRDLDLRTLLFVAVSLYLSLSLSAQTEQALAESALSVIWTPLSLAYTMFTRAFITFIVILPVVNLFVCVIVLPCN